MYYQYDRGNTVTELTDRHGDEIEHYRYDAFGNIFTGITSPYNTTGYTGQDYDDVAGLVQMDARWYSPSVGRFTSQDTYMGDMYSSQSLNRYSYVMNNPVNMWDPTGHVPVPTWVGDDTNLDINGNMAIKHELLSSSSSNSGWYNIGTVDNGKEIIYKYQATITKTWVYKRYLGLYDERIDDFKFIFGHNVTYSQTDYYFDDVVVPASKIAEESEKAIQELLGNPPKNTNPPVVSISTLQVGSGPVQLLNPDQVIVQNTGKKTTGSQSIVTGAVQSVLNNLFNKGLEVDGWYGSKTAGAISEFQKEHHLTANGKLDVKTFYQLQSLLPKPKSIPTLESEYKIDQNKINTEPVQVDIKGNDIIIEVYANFKGADESIYPDGSKTYEELAKDGLNMWEGTYNVFGREVNVTVNIIDLDEENKLNPGQEFAKINIKDKTGTSNVSYGLSEWSITNSGKMTVFTGTGKGSKERLRTQEEFSNTVAHEFGHMLGLDDAYGKGDRPEAIVSTEVPSNDLMRSNWGNPVVTDNDIEMLVLAWSTNEQQHYESYSEGFWIFKKDHTQSIAIGN
jgi:RHS repeat-associated protein